MKKYLAGILRFSGSAILVLCALSSARADGVTFYGTVDNFAAYRRDVGQGATRYTLESGGMQTSYWGLRGREELGSGMHAFFALESFFRADSGAAARFDGDAFFSRNSFVGLGGEWGSVRLGHNATPYFNTVLKHNPYAVSFFFSPVTLHTYVGSRYAVPGMAGDTLSAGLVGDSVWNNSVHYITPEWRGVSGGLMYAFGEQAGRSGQNKWTGYLQYGAGPLSAAVVHQNVGFNVRPVADINVPTSFQSQSATLLALSYNFDVLKLFATGQYIQNELDFGQVKTRDIQLGVNVPLYGGALLASVARATTDGGWAKETRNTMVLGYSYSLSKRTNVYVNGLSDRVTSKTSGRMIGVGVRHTF